MTKNRPLLLILVSLVLCGLVYLDNRGESTPQDATSVAGSNLGKAPPTVSDATESNDAMEQQDGAGAKQPANPGLNQLANPLASFDKSLLNNWVERPLFAPSRQRPPAVETVAKAPAREAKPKRLPPSYDLLGVVRDGDRAIALLRKKGDGTSFRVEVGDMIGGWRVSRLESAAVLLEREDGNSQMVPLTRE